MRLQDIAAVARIDAVPIILDMVKHVTGMRFAAVARVTGCALGGVGGR